MIKRLKREVGVFVLVEVGHGDPPLGLLHHVGLVPQADVDDGRRQLAGLSIHLHGDGLVGGERHFFTLMEALAVAAHLHGGLKQASTDQPHLKLQGETELFLF